MSESQGEPDEAKLQAEKLKDQREKLALTIEHLSTYCKKDSEHEVIRKMASALHDGDHFAGTIIANGATNYAFKVYLEKNPSLAVFCKVGFPRALWHPDPSVPYDLNRLNAESILMEKFEGLMGGRGKAPVAEPFGVLDCAKDVRVMMAQFVPANSEWAQQFLDGKVDRRIIPKVARAVATLNTAESDPGLNAGIKQIFRDTHTFFRQVDLEACKAGDPSNPAHIFLKSMGEEKINRMHDALVEDYDKAEVLLHGDCHVFNILVEEMVDENTFGPNGEFYFCDWEMSYFGPRGRDNGVFLSWPLLSALFLTAEGKGESAKEVCELLTEYWEGYCEVLQEKGKDLEYCRAVFRDTLTWAGYYLHFAWYVLNLPNGRAPVEKLPVSIGKTVHAACGELGLKFLVMGLLKEQPEMSLDEMKQWYCETVDTSLKYCTKLRESC